MFTPTSRVFISSVRAAVSMFTPTRTRHARDIRRLLLNVALFVAPLSVGCADDIVDAAIVAAVEISPPQATIGLGGSLQLLAVPVDASGNALDRTVQWSSLNTSIVTVSAAGRVTAQTVGTAAVQASVDGKTDQAQITVTQEAAGAGFQVVLSTYVGGTGDEDIVRDIAIDAQGNVYLAGGTNSADFPTTAGAVDGSFNNPGSTDQDAFVMKVSPSGSLLWSTYLGSPNYDRAYAVEVDPQGYVYVAGRAGVGFPVTAGALQTTFGGGDASNLYGPQDGFVCKLTPTGALVYCTYFGNDDHVPIRDIAVDASGDVYAITSSDMGTFPSAWFANAYQPSRRGARDVLIARISADGSRVKWATYVGGGDEEFNTNTIRLDASGNVLFMTTTRSSDLPTPGGFDQTRNSPPDIYIGKLTADGSQLLFGTYLGGSNAEFTETHHLVVDGQGNILVAGMTLSSDFPTTNGAFQRTFGGLGGAGTGAGTNYAGDAFVSKISSDGTRLIASTYLGGSDGDGSEGISVDAQGNVYVPGTTYSSDFPTTEQPHGPAGGGDIFAARLSPDLSTLEFGRRFGGSGYEESRSGVVSASGTFYFGGMTRSSDLTRVLPLTASLRGRSDAVVIKLQPR